MLTAFGFLAALFGGIGPKIKMILGIAAIVSLLAGLGYVAYLKYELSQTANTIDDLTTQRDTATDVANRNAVAARTVILHDESVARLNAASAPTDAKLKDIAHDAEISIAKVPPSPGNALAPFWGDTLRRLRELDAAAGQ